MSEPNQQQLDRERAREVLREIVDSDIAPSAQKIAAAKVLLEADPDAGGNQELLAMHLTDEQLVDIIARAQAGEAAEAAEKRAQLAEQSVTPAAELPPDSGVYGVESVKSNDPRLTQVLNTPPKRPSLADMLAGVGDFDEDDPLCS